MEYTVNIEVTIPSSNPMEHSRKLVKVFSVVVNEETVDKAVKAAHIKAKEKWESYDWHPATAYFWATSVFEGRLKNLLSKRTYLK